MVDGFVPPHLYLPPRKKQRVKQPEPRGLEPPGGEIDRAYKLIEDASQYEANKRIEKWRYHFLRSFPHNPEKFHTVEDLEQIANFFQSKFKDPELQNLAEAVEEYRQLVEKHKASLNKDQAEWQKQGVDLVNRIRKLGDNAAELYKEYIEYPAVDNYKDHDAGKERAANERDFSIKLNNQAIALYYWTVTQKLIKLVDIPNDADFKQGLYHLNSFKDKKKKKEDLSKAAEECLAHAQLAHFHVGYSARHRRIVEADDRFITNLPNGIGRATPARRLLKLDHVEKCRERAKARVAELEQILSYVERQRQATEAKIDAYISQCEERSRALNAHRDRRHELGRGNGEIDQAHAALNRYRNIMVPNARNRATQFPIGDTTYADIANRIHGGTATAGDNGIIGLINGLATNAGTRVTHDQIFHIDMHAYYLNANIRAKESKNRARIAKAYNNHVVNLGTAMAPNNIVIKDETAKKVEEHANKTKEIFKELADNAQQILSSEKTLENKFLELNVKFASLQVLPGPAMRTPDQAAEADQLRDEIARAEIDINNHVTLQKEIREKVEKLLGNAYNELKREYNTVRAEEDTQSAITTQANTDLAQLRNLVRNQQAVEDTLKTTPSTGYVNLGGYLAPVPGLIEREKNFAEGLGKIARAISNKAQNLTAVPEAPQESVGPVPPGVAPPAAPPAPPNEDIKTDTLGASLVIMQVTAPQGSRPAFEIALQTLHATERAVAKALKRNAIHMGQDLEDEVEKAVEHLQKAQDKLTAQDGQGLKNSSEGHLFFDPVPGKLTINGIWMSLRQVEGFDYEPDPTNGAPRTRLRCRPDVTVVTVNRLARDSGKDEKYGIDVKRLMQEEITAEEAHAIIAIPGNDFKNGTAKGRRKAYILVSKVEKDNTTKQWIDDPLKDVNLHELFEDTKKWWSTHGGLTQEDAARRAEAAVEAQVRRLEALPNVEVKRIENMEAVKKISINQYLINEKRGIELSFDVTQETMPNPIINHAAALAARYDASGQPLESYTEEKKRRMWKINLDRRMFILPNGLEFPIDWFDFTETKWDAKNGLTLTFKGPGTLYQVNCFAAGSLDTFNLKMQNETTGLIKDYKMHLSQGIEWLKEASKTYYEKPMDDALRDVLARMGVEATQLGLTQRELEMPPSNRFQLEDLREKKKIEKDAPRPLWITASMQSTGKMLKDRRAYENKAKNTLKNIHTTNPLSIEYIRMCRAKPERYNPQMHPSSKEKHKFLLDLEKANGLDKRIPFLLLEDPKLGAPGPLNPAGVRTTGSAVKNASPNGLELLQEYNLYKNKQDFATPMEERHVKQYLKHIYNMFEGDEHTPASPMMPDYWKNAWNLERAMEAANAGNLLGKDVNGTHINGAKDYINKLKHVNKLTNSDDSLAGLRQADENQWITHVQEALAQVDQQGTEAVLKQAIAITYSMQISRFSNLKRALDAANLETPSDVALKILDKITVEDPFQPWSKPETDILKQKTDEQKKAKVGVDATDSSDPIAILKKNNEELAHDASDVAGNLYQKSADFLQSMIDSTSDAGIKQKYREAAVQLTMDFAKQEFDIYKHRFNVKIQFMQFEEYIKQMDRMWMKDTIRQLILLWMLNSVKQGTKEANSILGELLGLVKKVIS